MEDSPVNRGENMTFHLDQAAIVAAKQVARELLASGDESQAVRLGVADDASTLILSRSSEHVTSLHTFEVEGTTFYLGFTRPTTET